jgi:hypothetical protein
MKNGICPKCHSTQIYRGASIEGQGLTAGTYNSLIELNAGKTQATLWIDTFICGACGYMEMHVANRDDLEWLPQADGWERIIADEKML